MNARDIVLIEEVDETGTHWFISFDGPNPTTDRCVKCVDRESAIRLKTLILEMRESARVGACWDRCRSPGANPG